MTHQHPFFKSIRWGKRRIFFACGILFLIAATVVIAHEGHTPLPSKGSKVDPARGLIMLSADARTALDVRTAEIGDKPAPDSILAYASLVTPWKSHAFAVSRLPGRIVGIHVKPGQEVPAGFVLAEVESQESELLRLEIQNARTELRLAEQILSGLKDSGAAIAESSLLAAESQLKQAKNTLEIASAKWLALGLAPESLAEILKGATAMSAKLPIRSPVKGTVIHADLAIGKMVEPGEHLFEIVDLSRVLVRIGVLERDLNRVSVGQPISVQLTVYPGEIFHGKVAVVGSFLDPVTHLNDAWVEFQNPTGTEPRLLPGMSGQARIEIPPSKGTRTIPMIALINDGVDRFVLVEEASASGLSEYRKRSVEIVRESSDWVEIRSGDLFPGDRVVTQGSHELGTFFAPGIMRLSPESSQSIGLKIEPAAAHGISKVIEVPGLVDLSPDQRNSASARLGGTITSIRVERGQAIRPGDPLAEIFSLDLLNMQLDLLRESLAAELAGEQLARLRKATDSVSRRRLVDAEAVAVSSENRRESLARRLKLFGLTSEDLGALVKERRMVPTLTVRASMGGNVVRFERVIGQTVRADEPLFEIHDLSRPLIQAFVSEQNLTGVRLGQMARIRLISDPQKVIVGKVVRSGRTFAPNDRTLAIWVEPLTDVPALLRQNQMAQVALVLETVPKTLALPIAAILREGTRHFVFVKEDDSFVRRLVEVGLSDDQYIEVLSGLKEGEKVAITAVAELQTAFASVR